MTAIFKILIKCFAVTFAAVGCGFQIYHISYIYFEYDTVNQIYIGPANDVTPPSIVLCLAVANLLTRELEPRPNITISTFLDYVKSYSEIGNSSDLLTQLSIKEEEGATINFKEEQIKSLLDTRILLKDEGTLCAMFSLLPHISLDTNVYSHCDEREYISLKLSKPQLVNGLEWWVKLT